ncbi:MAG: RNA polymerase sigma factor [Archangium sp.]|nr:RNA polymerase sigma factor [Archangium sp.]
MTARGDDESAHLGTREFEALYTRLEKPVFNVVYRWLWNTEEARDVTQEAFMKVWGARRRVVLETVEPLVFRSALNLAANRLRGRKLRRFFSLESAGHEVDPRANPHASLEVQERRATVRKAIEALPEKLRSVVVLCELSGLSTQQIADTLHIPAGTVSSRRSLAMAALEKSLGALEVTS